MNLPTIDDIRDAAKRIAPYVHRTPVLTCSALNRMCGADLFFKCENFQKVGAFKIRGATNTAFLLSDEEASKGLATHSSGNHAAAVALAAKWRGTRAFVVMPENSPDIKKNAVAGYGAEIVFCKPTLEAREKTLVEVVERTGAAFIHPYNDFRVVSGQGTVALELLSDVPGLDIVIGPLRLDQWAMAAAVAEIVSDQELRARLGRRAQEKVGALYTVDRQAPEILELVKRLIAADGQRNAATE